MAIDPSNPLDEDWRGLDPGEAAVLYRLLASDFPGRNKLAEQARSALVRRLDHQGSLRFHVDGLSARVRGRVPVEGRYLDADAGLLSPRPTVNLLLHVIEGRLHELEVYKDDGSKILIQPFFVPPMQIEVFVE